MTYFEIRFRYRISLAGLARWCLAPLSAGDNSTSHWGIPLDWVAREHVATMSARVLRRVLASFDARRDGGGVLVSMTEEAGE